MKNKKLGAAIQYAKNFFTTGAVFETSRQTELEVCSRLPQDDHQVIVEYGIGHGNITREVLKNIAPTSKLYAFEINEKFCKHVSENISDDRLVIINAGAEELLKYIPSPVHGFVSTIPFTFFSKEKAQTILLDSYKLLEPGGYFSQMLYSKLHYKKFDAIFDECELVRSSKIPVEFVYHCSANKR